MNLQIKTPRWALPLLQTNARYLGAKGGRASGKSHFFAECVVERLIMYPDSRIVCIREIQRSLKFSAKQLIEDKIQKMGVGHLFDIQATEIHRVDASGIIIFQGMQDHTAESIKSLEGFDIAFCEEAQSLSSRSIELLDPTMRKDGAELWFSWNPRKEDDAVEQLFNNNSMANVVHVNYTDNPFVPDAMLELAQAALERDPDRYNHVWLGDYESVSESQVFYSKWKVDEFEPTEAYDGPYLGVDFGFRPDPLVAVKCWVYDETLFVEKEAYGVGIEIDDTHNFITKFIPDFDRYISRADSAEPKTISYLQRHGFPRMEGVKKWPNSVNEGIRFIRGFKSVIIHPSCKGAIDDFRMYSHKIDKLSGDILPDVVDANNHAPDAIRYAIAPLIKAQAAGKMVIRI
ncbi:MAG: putative terminase large subunit [Prokaryotic dsDNA virus sp.]|nr:MAG: putative terminase large subunit [Prokaryotic dsDNA virus sp.]